MSFPNVIYGNYGDEKVISEPSGTAVAKKIGGLPLGHVMVLPDGREFAHAQVNATPMVVGKLYEGEAVLAGTGWQTAVAVVAGSAQAGATTMTITASGTTAITANQFEEGTVHVASSIGTGVGWSYKINDHAAAATTVACVLNLKQTDPIKVTIAGGTATVGLRVNPLKNVLLTTADTVGVSALAGVSCSSAAASSYVWLQKKGLASVFTDATTLIVGVPVIASTTVAGAVGTLAITHAAGTTAATDPGKSVNAIGICVTPAASAEYSLVNLNIP